MPARLSLGTVLVPTRCCDPSLEALAWATSLAETSQAELHLLHVVEKPHLALCGVQLMSFSAPFLVRRLKRKAEVRMAALASEWESKLTVKRVARVGVPLVEILGYVYEHEIDVIVMGVHARGAVGHMLSGSLAERVVRQAPCPVLTVRPRPRAGRFGTKRDQGTPVEWSSFLGHVRSDTRSREDLVGRSD